jgi:ribosomal-protein-alanine N-acetyltransferase
MKTTILKMPGLMTDRLKLRGITPDDANDIFEYASIPEISEYLVWYPHKTIRDSEDFIKFAREKFENDEWIVLGIELKEKNKLIGTIDIRGWKNVHRCAEIGYVLSKEFWNRGITTEALKRVIDYCFGELNLNRVEAHCEDENTGSWRVMEKCGMKYEGTLRQRVFIKERYRSMKMYSILKSEYLK